MKYNFDEIIPRLHTNSVKYDGAQGANAYLPETNVPMWIADMDFACPPAVVDAIKRRADHRIFGYSSISDPAYFEAVTGWMRRRFGWDANADQLLYSSGIVEAINASVERLTKRGDEVILQTPAYHPFDDAIKKHKRKPLYSPLKNDNGYYTMDLADLEEKAARPKAKLFFLCSPHNPTGRVWSKDELTAVVDICLKHDVFVVCDEIHADLVRDGQKQIALATLYPNEKRIIYCTSPSKTFNIAGLQISNIFIPDETILADWRESRCCGSPNPLSIEAVIAAYNQSEDWCNEMNRYVDANFAFMKKVLAANLPAAQLVISEGTYLAWVNLGGFGLNDQELKQKVSAEGLFIEFADDFVADAAGYARVNLACPRATLEQGLALLCKALG